MAAEKAQAELDEWKSPAAVAGRAAQQRADTAQVGYEHPNTLRTLLRERTGATTRKLRGRT